MKVNPHVVKNDEATRAYHREYMKGWRKKHPGYSTKYTVPWAKAHPERDRIAKLRYHVIHGKRNARRGKLLRKYGLTVDQYEAMFARQGGKCALCGGVSRVTANLDVDHDHATGVVRALLCNRCNKAIGYFRDDVDLVYAAAEYLSMHGRPLVKLAA